MAGRGKGTRISLGLMALAVGVLVAYVGVVALNDIVPVVLGFALAGLGAMFTVGQVGEV